MAAPVSLSVVIPSYNGAESLPALLRALERQTIPRERFEVLVVDDCSTDGTADVAEAFGARVIRQASNGGAGVARNAGIRQAVGNLIAFIDDDCVPEERWLARLTDPFEDVSVDGAGGQIVAYDGEGVVLGYLLARNPWTPLPASLLRSSNPLYRLGLYLRSVLLVDRQPALPAELFAVAGANMAFRADVLRELGGFSSDLRVSEETDLCVRLHARPGGGRIVNCPEAVIHHHFHATLSEMIRRARWYGQGAAMLAERHTTINYIVFPFPVLTLLGTLTALWRFGWRAVPMLAVLPLATYPGWLIHSARRRRIVSLLYPHLQLVQEIATMAGELDEIRRRA